MPTVPTKLFDIRQGNGATDSDTTVYPRATLIVYKDNASKNAIEAAITAAYGLPNTSANFNKVLTDFIKAHYRNSKGNDAAVVAQAAADNELPRSLN